LLVFFSVSALLEPKKADAKEVALFFFVATFFSSLRRGVEGPEGMEGLRRRPEAAAVACQFLRVAKLADGECDD
jgi:hypothetical protein